MKYSTDRILTTMPAHCATAGLKEMHNAQVAGKTVDKVPSQTGAQRCR